MLLLFMVALCNRADHYIFALWFLYFILFSSLNLSGRRLDVEVCGNDFLVSIPFPLPSNHSHSHPFPFQHCILSANLECRSNSVLHAACWKYRTQKFAICAPSHITATALKQQISKFYSQILNTEPSFYIYDRPLIDTNVVAVVLNLRIKFWYLLF